MDVSNVLLYGDLDEEVFMKTPPGFSSSDPTKVCHLSKFLYGLLRLQGSGLPRCLQNYVQIVSFAPMMIIYYSSIVSEMCS